MDYLVFTEYFWLPFDLHMYTCLILLFKRLLTIFKFQSVCKLFLKM